MPAFEFMVRGPAVSTRATGKGSQQRRRYHRWIDEIAAAARREWPSEGERIGGKIEVLIRNFYTEAPPDVDNVIKPILDALKGLVYADDAQVYRVTSEKHELPAGLGMNPSQKLATALATYSEVLQVVVLWEVPL